MKKEIVFQCNVSPRNSEFARLAAKLVAKAVRLHGTIDLRSLTPEELHGQDD